jgi:chromosome segregation ATPase
MKEKIMSLMKALTLGCALCLSTFVHFTPTSTFAQTRKQVESAQTDRDQALQQLLEEVRELRLAVQRATITNTRFQMLIERARTEQARVDSIGRQLESLRSQVADMRAAKPHMDNQIKDAESQLDRATDVNARADLESNIKAMKDNLARIGREEERLQNRDVTLNAELQVAQSKLDELNSQLDALMNELKSP